MPLPPTSTYFCKYCWPNAFYNSSALNLNHIVLALADSSPNLSTNDYLNIAFYNMDFLELLFK